MTWRRGDFFDRSSHSFEGVLISVGAVLKSESPTNNVAHRILFFSSHPQWMGLESLGVGLEGDHHTFTNFPEHTTSKEASGTDT